MPSVTFQPTAGDFVAAYRLAFVTSFKTMRALLCYALGATPFAMIGAVYRSSEGALFCVTLFIMYSLIFTVVVTIIYLFVPVRARRLFSQQKSAQNPFRVEWSEKGITFKSDRLYRHIFWNELLKSTENSRAILLYQSDVMFSFIPKRVLSPEQAASIMAFARR